MLTAIDLSGQIHFMGETGDVFRLTATGRARLVNIALGLASNELDCDATLDSAITLTSAETYQEIGELKLGGAKVRVEFVTLGTGYLIDNPRGPGRFAIALSRRVPAVGREEDPTFIATCFVFDPIAGTCQITATVFGDFPDN